MSKDGKQTSQKISRYVIKSPGMDDKQTTGGSSECIGSHNTI
ncbi:hypothetical protein K310107B6_05170 [Mediterraneibacter gnavus]